MADIFEKKDNTKVLRTVTQIGKHNERYWQLEFPIFFDWLVN